MAITPDVNPNTPSRPGDADSASNGLEFIDLRVVKPDPEAMALAPGEYALSNLILPVRFEGEAVIVAAPGIESFQAVDDLGILIQRPVMAAIGDKDLIREKLQEFLLQRIMQGLPSDEGTLSDAEETTDLADLTKMAGETEVVQLVNGLFAQAIKDSASDIHIEPFEREVKVRYRIDGMLHDMMRPPKRLHPAIISRLKILGEMNIAERRLPQDGRIKITVGGKSIDVRVSIVPTVFGERAVMRILDKGTAMMGLPELGMGPDVLEKYRKLISLPHGIILATGPTGSGKSTTLYASLQEIWSPTTNILTVEDPVEYQVSGIGQVHVRPNIGLTFAAGLRAFLRQDPDIIMVGEIRDVETAEIAVHASLTGHLVFSTLHTNDSSGAVTRLLDMGVEPYLVASSLVGVVAQRLLRRVCSNCAQPYSPTSESIQALGLTKEEVANGQFMRGRGCERCQNSGYRGRQGLYELLIIDEEIRRMTVDRKSSNEIKNYAIENQGLRTLLMDGRTAVLAGKTTPEEVLRVSQREDF